MTEPAEMVLAFLKRRCDRAGPLQREMLLAGETDQFISFRQLADGTGLDIDATFDAVDELHEQRIIRADRTAERGNGEPTYGLRVWLLGPLAYEGLE